MVPFVFPIIHSTYWGPGLLEMAKHLPTIGSSELVPCFALFVFAAFAFSVKLSSSQPMSFFAATISILSLSLLVWEWVRSSIGLGCWLGLNYYIHALEMPVL